LTLTPLESVGPKELLSTGGARKGIMAFLENRQPEWTNN